MTLYLKVPVTVLQLVEYLKELVTVQPVLLVVLKEPMYLNVPVTVLLVDDLKKLVTVQHVLLVLKELVTVQLLQLVVEVPGGGTLYSGAP